jgi:outer membrane murein-binding lipoprotein Lpp
MGMGGTARRLAVVLGTAVLGAALVAGCSDDGAGERSSTTSTTESTTTTAAVDPEEAERAAVVAAVEAAEDAAGAAFAPPTPNPQHPDLLATHTGPMLEERQLLASGLVASGWAIRRPEDTKFRVEVDLDSVRFDPDNADVAFLTTCAVDDGERFVVETGEVVASGLFTIEFTDAMQRVDGVWKLAERREENLWDGEAGCAVE